MIAVSVLVVFVTSIMFNVILPTGDVYSDVGLMVNTLGFDLGTTLELIGCRICYGKNEDDFISKENESCPFCVENLKRRNCANSLVFLNKIHELQKSLFCTNQTWKVQRYEKEGFEHSWVEKSKEGQCNKNQDECCLETNDQRQDRNSLPNVDMRVIIAPLHRDDNICNQFSCDVLVGNSSVESCENLFYLTHVREQLSNITKNLQPQSEEHFFKLKTINERRVSISKGFLFEDGCGAYLRPLSMKDQSFRKRCGVDACLLHIHDIKLHESMSGIRDLNEWKTNSNFMFAIRVGGKNCKMLELYGWAMAIPLILSLLFNIFGFYNDMKNGDATKYDILPLIFLFYPQWRSLKILGKFIFYHRDEGQLNSDMNKFDKQLGSLEPFLESAIQVIMLQIFSILWKCHYTTYIHKCK